MRAALLHLHVPRGPSLLRRVLCSHCCTSTCPGGHHCNGACFAPIAAPACTQWPITRPSRLLPNVLRLQACAVRIRYLPLCLHGALGCRGPIPVRAHMLPPHRILFCDIPWAMLYPFLWHSLSYALSFFVTFLELCFILFRDIPWAMLYPLGLENICLPLKVRSWQSAGSTPRHARKCISDLHDVPH